MSSANDFKVGDIVYIRSWEDMESEFGVNGWGDIDTNPYFVTNMSCFCEQQAQIVRVKENYLLLFFFDEVIERKNSNYYFPFEAVTKTISKEKAHSDIFNDKFSKMEAPLLTVNERNDLLCAMDSLLSKYNYHQTKEGLNVIIDTWYHNKAHIIELFKKHPNYNGNYQIEFDAEYTRDLDLETAIDVLEGFNYVSIDEIMVEPDTIRNILRFFYTIIQKNRDSVTLTSSEADELNSIYTGCHAREGQKISKVFGKMARETGLNNFEDYNTLYPRFCDAINPLTFSRKTILSVNPIDYYTMSFGDSWQSCHTIDKHNQRRNNGEGYQGCYSSGTESYMLDSTSFIFYTINEDLEQNKGTANELCDKAQRCMFHLGEDKLIQGRVYPQGTDGADHVYREIREIVQKIISECFEIPNYWTNKMGTGECNRVIESIGTHYRDYLNFSNCNVSFLKNNFNPNRKYITVGNTPICPCCGEKHGEEATIECENCYNEKRACTSCGCRVSEDEGRIIDGFFYCDDCIIWCDYHHCYEINEYIDFIHIHNFGIVCEEGYMKLDEGGLIGRCSNCECILYTPDSYTDENGNYFDDQYCLNQYRRLLEMGA